MKNLKYWWYRNMPWYAKIYISPLYDKGNFLLIDTSKIGENLYWVYCGQGVAVLLKR